LSAEHFSVDGTLLKAWASMKSFRPKDGSGEAAAAMSERLPEGATLGADKNYDAEPFVEGLKAQDRAACGDQRIGQQERQGAQDRCPR
jgi:hypothetical protein